MPVVDLSPQRDLLREDYVLVQAWKKTASFIRQHNWFSDTLDLDFTSVNLRQFLEDVSQRLSHASDWKSDAIRIVPAPKSQRWRIGIDRTTWAPVDAKASASKLRPLAHVSLKDQVAATAIMLCLADRVETLQGDPRIAVPPSASDQHIASYGNRLFCDPVGANLRHRWGSTKLYRAFYQDYRRFIYRPEAVAQAESDDDDQRILIVHSDLRQFYDRVRPALLFNALESLREPDDDPEFFSLARAVLSWQWHGKDTREVASYAEAVELDDFTNVVLPQGLVAAGFFANLALLEFDRAISQSIGAHIPSGVVVLDYCRYVDDIRLVVRANKQMSLDALEETVADWLQKLLDVHATGLLVSPEKTQAAAFRGDERPVVRQSRRMSRIQAEISGGFDAIKGMEILEAVRGLVRAQRRHTRAPEEESNWTWAPVPDTRDSTVSRFAAGRYRSTYRSLRPLLQQERVASASGSDDDDSHTARGEAAVGSRRELDDDAKAFALGLIESWIEDPSNVRVLRIALDLWPDGPLLRNILDLLRPFTEKDGPRKAPRRVAWYCLAELFRAGATETGYVEDNDSLPDDVDIAAYRKILLEEANRLAMLPATSLPWYLKQQILLFLAVTAPESLPNNAGLGGAETKRYREFLGFQQGNRDRPRDDKFASLAVLDRRAYRPWAQSAGVHEDVTPERLEAIAERDPMFAVEVCEKYPELRTQLSPATRSDLCIADGEPQGGWTNLADLVLRRSSEVDLRNEAALLAFAERLLTLISASEDGMSSGLVTPATIRVRLSDGPLKRIGEVELITVADDTSRSMYEPPSWCPEPERWRFHLGYILRFVLSSCIDFRRVIRHSRSENPLPFYREPENHWYYRAHGLFSGHAAFGEDSLPISGWVERLLSALLAWPGCRNDREFEFVNQGLEATRDAIKGRIQEVEGMRGASTGALILPLAAPSERSYRGRGDLPLRACVVQTAFPGPDDFNSDPTLSDPEVRRRHRNHVSAALEAVKSMLALRETHLIRDGRLDLLILPELAVHPRDVKTHLIPFARAYKTIVLAGLVYERLPGRTSLTNSALWIVPTISDEHGLQVIVRRQGKQNLAPVEKALSTAGDVVEGFRPCQWLIEYKWSRDPADRPLLMTASVCYDATDLGLAADLRKVSDVFVVPALNKDVNTFDHIALALHYHMFQMVVVANSGAFGGSNAYAPYDKPYIRQVFHLHGQPQASIAFFEIDDIADFIRRGTTTGPAPASASAKARDWKSPPAGWLESETP